MVFNSTTNTLIHSYDENIQTNRTMWNGNVSPSLPFLVPLPTPHESWLIHSSFIPKPRGMFWFFPPIILYSKTWPDFIWPQNLTWPRLGSKRDLNKRGAIYHLCPTAVSSHHFPTEIRMSLFKRAAPDPPRGVAPRFTFTFTVWTSLTFETHLVLRPQIRDCQCVPCLYEFAGKFMRSLVGRLLGR